MDERKSGKTLFICRAAVIAALYVVLTWVSNLYSGASGVIQVRLSEALCILPVFTSAAIPGLTVGCLLANLLTGCIWADVIFGPVATLIGAVGTYLLRRMKWLAPIPPIVANALIVPLILSYAYHVETAIPFMILTVGAGEIISVYVLGMILFFALNRHKKALFD